MGTGLKRSRDSQPRAKANFTTVERSSRRTSAQVSRRVLSWSPNPESVYCRSIRSPSFRYRRPRFSDRPHGVRRAVRIRENSGISWFTFCAGERAAFAYRKPNSDRCSAQSAGKRDARRINVIALRCCGCRPLRIAVVMSGANHGRRRSV